MLGQNEDLFSSLSNEQMLGFLDDGLFDAEDEPAQFARVKRFKRPRAVMYEWAQDAARRIGPLEEDEHVDMIVSGNFIAGDFIEAYLEANGMVADEIIISTLSLSRENVDSLKNIQQAYLTGKMGLIVSDYFFANERHDGIEDIITQLADDDFYFAVAGIHTKLTLIKTQCGQNLIMGGSANLRSSLNVEQITLDNNQALYAFHREWMSKILNEYHVKHKMLRRDALWQLVVKNAAPAKPDAVTGRQH